MFDHWKIIIPSLACSWLCQYVSGCCAYNSYDFDSDHRLVIAYICTPGTKVARYEKQPEIKEWFVKTTLEKLENLNLNSTNSVRNDCLISSVNWNINLTPFYQGPSPPHLSPWFLKETVQVWESQKRTSINSNHSSHQR